MKRGDIYFADLDPTVGTEIKKKRPVLIVSNNANNKVSNTVTIVPITSNVTKLYPFEIKLNIEESALSKVSKAQCHQIRTISKLRIQRNRIGRLDDNIMRQIDTAIKIHLDLA